MPNFTACDLCLSSLRARLIDVQVSHGTIVQISDDGTVAHQAGRLRVYRLCEECGNYLLGTVRDLAVREDETFDSRAAASG